jgi:histidinol dehydrogenase
MNVVRYTDAGFSDRVRQLLSSSSLFDPMVEERTRGILEAVRTSGDDAVLEYTERFDGAKLAAEQLPVMTAELVKASLKVTEGLRSAIATAANNVEKFSRKGLRKGWSALNGQGGRVGEKFDPFQRVGIYVPGGTAPLVSTALMTVLLAKVAGCPEIVVCTPCNSNGEINPSLLYAVRTAGATSIFRIGGAQAIAAMGYGTATVPKVQKVFGPGNAYVVAAKRLLFGHVAVDLLPGPSELLVLADDSANAGFVAADLLAQAEHGSGHERVWLVTTSPKLLASVEKEIAQQLSTLPRKELIEKALFANGWLILVKTTDQGIELANEIAPEHCEVMTRQSQRVADQIKTAGAIFLGDYSPTVLGDYVAGPSHTLPTGGAGASFAGLTVDQFQRRTSVVEYSRGALSKSLSALETFAEVEGLDAHGRSAKVRIQPRPAKRKR